MNLYVELAKKAVESYVKNGEVIGMPNDLPKEMIENKSGTFVSIFQATRETDAKQERETNAKKELRGCIGTYLPTKANIAQEIIHNAVASAAEDYRFGPIQKEELPYLSYAVYILEKPELVSNTKELDPKKYGIIVKTSPITSPDGTDVVFNGHFVAKSALLLPDLEGIDTIEKQISIACRKGGINPIKENILIYRFEVKKYI